jgi:ATF/CREB family transcription factor
MFPAPSPNSQAILQQLQNGGATPSTLDFHRTALAAKKNNANAPTSNPNEQEQGASNMDAKPARPADFTQHDAADAANGLFMLAKGGQQNNTAMNQPPMQNDSRAAARRVSQNTNGTSAEDMSEPEPAKPAKGKGKKNAKAPAASNRRKAEEPAKGPNKRTKMSMDMPSDMDDEDDDDDDMKRFPMDTKKMTDEEKRRNFLERNRYDDPLIYLDTLKS